MATWGEDPIVPECDPDDDVEYEGEEDIIDVPKYHLNLDNFNNNFDLIVGNLIAYKSDYMCNWAGFCKVEKNKCHCFKIEPKEIGKDSNGEKVYEINTLNRSIEDEIVIKNQNVLCVLQGFEEYIFFNSKAIDYLSFRI